MAHASTSLAPQTTTKSKNNTADLFEYLMPEDPNGARAAAVWNQLAPNMEGILERFYERLGKTPHLASRLNNSTRTAKDLAKSQTGHWQNVFTGHDMRTFERDARKVGSAHVRIGLTSDWFIAGYGRVLMDAIPAVMKAHRFTPHRATEALQILVARMFMDMALGNESYSSQMTDQDAIEWREDSDYHTLKTISGAMTDLNQVTLNIALLSDSTSRSTSSSESVAAAVEELVSSIQQLSETSQNAADAAADTNKRLEEGVQGVVKARQAINTVSKAADRSNESLSSLQDAAREINDVMSVIQSIADQTNLLALNATIEAARAGEAGKGFAVVASEVKALANQTASATDDVAARIQTLQDEISRISSNFQATQSAIETGEETLTNASEQIETAGYQMNSVAGRMSEVAQILEQQEASSTEISGHIAGISDLARDNAESLNSISDSLQDSNDQLSKSATKWFKNSSGRSLCEMAKIDHTLFKKRAIDTVLGRGNWTAADVPDNHSCRLGKWYDGIEDADLRQTNAFKTLDKHHHDVHHAAVDALKASASGDRNAALDLLKKLDTASNEVTKRLDEMSAFLHSKESIEERRKRERVQVEGKPIQMHGDGKTVPALVVDEGPRGIGVEGVSQSDVGQVFTLNYNGEREGVVRWASGKRGGIEFDD